MAPKSPGTDRVIRVVLTGSECTGKTTLAATLAAHYGVEFVPEYVREYVAQRGAQPDVTDHDPIARGQIALEDEYLSRATDLLIYDTDLLSTMVYGEHYFGAAAPWLMDAVIARLPDLYLLLDVDVPWVADPQRDRGHMRQEMQSLFRSALERVGARWLDVRGTWPRREQISIAAIDELRNNA